MPGALIIISVPPCVVVIDIQSPGWLMGDPDAEMNRHVTTIRTIKYQPSECRETRITYSWGTKQAGITDFVPIRKDV
jgi:hypothetical protein